MAKFIQHRDVEYITVYELHFNYSDTESHWGFSFPCDKNGVVDESQLGDVAKQSLLECRQGTVDGRRVDPGKIISWERKHVIPAVIECSCGAHVELWGFTNTCDCGADYNTAGQRLAPRSQWGEETGESVEDILSVDYTSTDDLLDD